jgi:hypothetical protein
MLNEEVNGKGFADVCIGAQPIGFFDVGYQIRGGHHHDGNDGALRVRSNPADDLETIQERHFDIEQEQARKWVTRPICIRRSRFEICNDLCAVGYKLDGIIDACLFEGNPQQLGVLLVIFGDENWSIRIHAGISASSWKKARDWGNLGGQELGRGRWGRREEVRGQMSEVRSQGSDFFRSKSKIMSKSKETAEKSL